MSFKKFFNEPSEHEVTDQKLYQQRRSFIKQSANMMGRFL